MGSGVQEMFYPELPILVCVSIYTFNFYLQETRMKYLALILTLSVVCADDFSIIKSLTKCYKNFQNIPELNKRQGWQKYCLDKNPYARQRFHGWTKETPNIQEYYESGNLPKPLRSKRVRKEYRMLTTRERHEFHHAINLLKQDTVSSLVDINVLANLINYFYCTLLQIE